MKRALLIGLRAGIRTFAQNMVGALGALTVVSLSQADMAALGATAALGTLASAIGALAAFFQNFAEQLPTEPEAVLVEVGPVTYTGTAEELTARK